MIAAVIFVVLCWQAQGQSLLVSFHGGKSPSINNYGVYGTDGTLKRFLIQNDNGLRELRGIAQVGTDAFLFANAYAQNSSIMSTDCAGEGLTVATTAMLSHPYGVALDGTSGTVYVTNQDTNNVVSFNVASPGDVQQFADADTPRGVAVDPASGQVFVASETAGVLVFKAADGSAPTATIPVSKPIGLHVSNGLLYVSDADATTPAVYAYSIASLALVKTYTASSNFGHPCGLGVRGDTLFVLAQDSTALFSFSVSDGSYQQLVSSMPDTPEQLLITENCPQEIDKIS